MDQDSGAPPPEEEEPDKVVREPTEGVRIIGAEEAADAADRPDVVSRIPADRPRFGDRPSAGDAAPPPLAFPAPGADDPNTFGAVPIISADAPPPPGMGGSRSPFSDEEGLEFDAPPPPAAPPTEPIDTGRTMAGDEGDLGRMLGGRRDRRDAAKDAKDESAGRRSRRGRRRGRRGSEDAATAFEDLLASDDEPIDTGDHDLPHWTRPATGEVPKVLAPDEGAGGDESVWSGLGGGPRYHDEHAQHEADDFSDLSDITLAESAAGRGEGPAVGVDEFGEFGAVPPPPAPPAPIEPPPMDLEPEPVPEPEPSLTPGAPYPEARPAEGGLTDIGHVDDGSGAGRDLPVAVGVGVGLFIGYVILNMIGTWAVTLLVLVVIVMGAIEFFNAVRRVGYHPAVLPGLVATAAMVLGVHWKGEPAFLLVTFLTLAVLMVWYVIGLQHERAVANIGITFFGVMWIGGLGSFAALMLSLPNGEGLLAGAVITTVAYDVGAYVVGRQMGKTPLSPSSPNKTMEGVVGGGVAAILVSVIILGIIGVFPWDLGDAFVLGLAVAIVAPLGDLCESMLKRDLGLKDMGSILPGHGGLLDRFDALLFVLPVTYYVVRLLDVLLNTP